MDQVLDGQFQSHDGDAEFSLAEGPGWGGAPEDFVARHGDFGLDLEEYDHVSIGAGFSASSAGASGSWTLTGYVNDCEPVCDGSSCSGCPGSTPVVLLSLDLVASPVD